MSRQNRILALAFGSVLLAIFVVAASLQPSTLGYGTHRQLGLPPCSMQLIFGRPCPACGMTTAWAHFVRGHWIDAWAANPAGLLLAVALLPAAMTAVFAAVFSWPVPTHWVTGGVVVVALAMVFAGVRWVAIIIG